MGALPWIKVSVDLIDHPKTSALCRRLDDPRAWAFAVATWIFFAKFAPAGSIPATDDAVASLEGSARWGGEAGRLVAALIEVGLLHRRGKRIVAHAWDEWQGAHSDKLERDRARMRDKRAKQREMRRATVERPSRDGRALEERRGEVEETVTDRGSVTPMKHPQASVPPAQPAAPQILLPVEPTTATTAPAPAPALVPARAKKAAKAPEPTPYDGKTQAEALAYLRGVAALTAREAGKSGWPAADGKWTGADNGSLVALLKRCGSVPAAAVAVWHGVSLDWPKDFARAFSREAVAQGAAARTCTHEAALAHAQRQWDESRGVAPPPAVFVDPMRAHMDRTSKLQSGETPDGWTVEEAAQWRAKNLDGRPNGAVSPAQPMTTTAPTTPGAAP